MCVFTSPFFFFFFTNLRSSIVRREERIVIFEDTRRNFRVSMKGDGIYRVVWFILWTNVSRVVEPGFLSPDVGWQRVTQVFAAYARCRGDKLSVEEEEERFWKCLEIFVEDARSTFWFKTDRGFRVLTGLEIAIVKYFVGGSLPLYLNIFS